MALTRVRGAADNVFDTVALAKAANLKVGDRVETLGYTSANDGGGARYRVVAATGTDDGGSYHDMTNGNQLELIVDGAVNVKQFGATGDNATDDRDAIQAAIEYAVEVYFPEGNYRISTALNQTQRNILTGEGRASRIIGTASDMFNIGVAAGVSDQSVFRNLEFVSAVGAGHIFVQSNQVVKYRFENLYCEQQNTDKHIFVHDSDNGNHIGNVWEGGKFIHQNTATVPAFKFVVSSTAGATNFNVWSNVEILRGSRPWFYFESARANNYIYDVFLENILCEITVQGIAECYGINGFHVDGMTVYDLASGPTVTEDMFRFTRGTNASSQPSRNISIKNYTRLESDATLSGNVDFECSSASGASVQNLEFFSCSRNIASNILADLTSAFDVTIYSSRLTVSGSGYSNITKYSSEGMELTQQSLTLTGTVSNQSLDGDTKLLRCDTDGASRSLTGMIAPAYERVINIYNADSTYNVSLVHDASSTAANRFYCPSSVNYVLAPFTGCRVMYDTTFSRWIVLDS